MVDELDFSSIQPFNPDYVKFLTSELHHAVQVSKAIQTGFIYEEKRESIDLILIYLQIIFLQE